MTGKDAARVIKHYKMDVEKVNPDGVQHWFHNELDLTKEAASWPPLFFVQKKREAWRRKIRNAQS